MSKMCEQWELYNDKSKWILLLLIFPIFISFWFFSRFTVDDAFISWRYGKNLVEFGIWNYNPTSFDITQAYTSPIYALLSILPNWIGIDIVLFFKIFSIFLLLTFIFWFYRLSYNNLLMLLIFLALPATFIHLFSGLETFLFVVLLTALLIYLYEQKFFQSLIVSMLLMITRPEAWLLLGLVPLYFGILSISTTHKKKASMQVFLSEFDWRRFFIASLILSASLFFYFLIHYLLFSNIFPNTFYVKTNGNLSLRNFIYFSLYAMPLTLLIAKKKYTLFFFLSLFFGTLIVNYSTSKLMMNYVERFGFHIFAPVFLLTVYISSKYHNEYFILSNFPILKINKKISAKVIINLCLLFVCIIFAWNTMNLGTLAHISNYYPRALDAHAELGKTLSKLTSSSTPRIEGFSFGDAGMTAYHSNLIALDNVGLGSSLVAKSGITSDIIREY